jgi:hypothetical protein
LQLHGPERQTVGMREQLRVGSRLSWLLALIAPAI